MFTDSGSSVLVDASGVDQEVVLDSLRAFHVEEVRREQGMVLLAVQWVRLNPGPMPQYLGAAPVAGGGDDAAAADSAGSAACEDGSNGLLGVVLDVEDEVWVELAERGCPPVDDLTIPVFATAAGMSEFQARKL